MSVGNDVIQEIIKQGMFRVAHPDPDQAHVFVWHSGSEEQIEAVVSNHPIVQVPKKLAEIFGKVLQDLGAPDTNDPRDLIQWAEQIKKESKNELHRKRSNRVGRNQ